MDAAVAAASRLQMRLQDVGDHSQVWYKTSVSGWTRVLVCCDVLSHVIGKTSDMRRATVLLLQ